MAELRVCNQDPIGEDGIEDEDETSAKCVNVGTNDFKFHR